VKYTTDQDGKSKTASAVDQEHYPEQHEVKNPTPSDNNEVPEGNSEQDWQAAEAKRNAAKTSQAVQNSTKRKGGSVQHE
jgi:hypothetical protein